MKVRCGVCHRKESRILPVPNFPDYFVSDIGNVYSEKFSQRKMLSPWRDCRDGRRVFYLQREAKQRRIFAAVAVLMAFIGERPKGLWACHGPRGEECDCVGNLSWETPKKNMGADKRRDGTMLIGTRHPRHTLAPAQVREIRSLNRSGLRLCEISQNLGLNSGTVWSVLHGRTWGWLK